MNKDNVNKSLQLSMSKILTNKNQSAQNDEQKIKIFEIIKKYTNLEEELFFNLSSKLVNRKDLLLDFENIKANCNQERIDIIEYLNSTYTSSFNFSFNKPYFEDSEFISEINKISQNIKDVCKLNKKLTDDVKNITSFLNTKFQEFKDIDINLFIDNSFQIISSFEKTKQSKLSKNFLIDYNNFNFINFNEIVQISLNSFNEILNKININKENFEEFYRKSKVNFQNLKTIKEKLSGSNKLSQNSTKIGTSDDITSYRSSYYVSKDQINTERIVLNKCTSQLNVIKSKPNIPISNLANEKEKKLSDKIKQSLNRSISPKRSLKILENANQNQFLFTYKNFEIKPDNLKVNTRNTQLQPYETVKKPIIKPNSNINFFTNTTDTIDKSSSSSSRNLLLKNFIKKDDNKSTSTKNQNINNNEKTFLNLNKNLSHQNVFSQTQLNSVNSSPKIKESEILKNLRDTEIQLKELKESNSDLTNQLNKYKILSEQLEQNNKVLQQEIQNSLERDKQNTKKFEDTIYLVKTENSKNFNSIIELKNKAISSLEVELSQLNKQISLLTSEILIKEQTSKKQDKEYILLKTSLENSFNIKSNLKPKITYSSESFKFEIIKKLKYLTSSKTENLSIFCIKKKDFKIISNSFEIKEFSIKVTELENKIIIAENQKNSLEVENLKLIDSINQINKQILSMKELIIKHESKLVKSNNLIITNFEFDLIINKKLKQNIVQNNHFEINKQAYSKMDNSKLTYSSLVFSLICFSNKKLSKSNENFELICHNKNNLIIKNLSQFLKEFMNSLNKNLIFEVLFTENTCFLDKILNLGTFGCDEDTEEIKKITFDIFSILTQSECKSSLNQVNEDKIALASEYLGALLLNCTCHQDIDIIVTTIKITLILLSKSNILCLNLIDNMKNKIVEIKKNNISIINDEKLNCTNSFIDEDFNKFFLTTNEIKNEKIENIENKDTNLYNNKNIFSMLNSKNGQIEEEKKPKENLIIDQDIFEIDNDNINKVKASKIDHLDEVNQLPPKILDNNLKTVENNHSRNVKSKISILKSNNSEASKVSSSSQIKTINEMSLNRKNIDVAFISKNNKATLLQMVENEKLATKIIETEPQNEELFHEQLRNLKSELRETRIERDAFKQKYEKSITLQIEGSSEIVSLLSSAFLKLITEINLTSKVKELVVVCLKILNFSQDEIENIVNGKNKILKQKSVGNLIKIFTNKN